MRKVLGIWVMCFLMCLGNIKATEADKLFYALRTKILSVKDYTADVRMKIDINRMKIPQLKGTLYFKSPDKLRLERKGGLSILPKKNINLTLCNLMPSGNVTVIDMGSGTLEGKKVRIIKVIPEDEQSNIILAKLWIDEANMLILKTETTSRNDGTIAMDLTFGKYASYALPDRVTISMDVKDYKLPKGITMDYNDVPTPPKPAGEDKKGKTKKGTIQISYLSYNINKGIPDERFKDRE
jgi:outer membrane lipoprotein-sorting protein